MNVEHAILPAAGPLAVLKLLEHGAKHGYELAELLRHGSGVLDFGQAMLYPLLYNLEAQGFVRAQWRDQDGHSRKYYQLTPLGQDQLTRDLAQWKAVEQAIRALDVPQAAPFQEGRA